jgi:hypothetical protein
MLILILNGSAILTAVRCPGWQTLSPHIILVGKPEGKRPLGRQRHRWVNNTEIDLREIVWYGID